MPSSNLHRDHAMALVYAAAVRDVRYQGAAALAFLVWQALLTFDDEVQFVWAMHNKNPFKWMYFYLRYVVIAGHVMHNCLMGLLADGSNSPTLCDLWYAYIIIFQQSIATLFELILASRVFALYNRSRRVACLLFILILAEIGMAMRMLWLRHAIIKSYRTCLLVSPSSARYQSLMGFIVHCTLIGLTLFKYVVASRAGWGRTPLVSLVIRDGSTAYATKTFIFVAVLLLFGLPEDRGVALFFWATALASITSCYLVTNMERFARRELRQGSPEEIITSKFSIGLFDGWWTSIPSA